jgi:hypothetical protein
LHHRLQILGQQFAQKHGRDPVLTVEHQRGRDDGGGVLAAERDQGAHGRIVDRGVTHVAVVDEVQGRLAVVVADIDAEKRHAGAPGGVVHLLQLSDLGPARSTPLPPHVDDDHLSGDIVQRPGARRVGQVGPGQRAGAAAACGRVVEDVGLPSRGDEFEGATLGHRVATGAGRK